MAVRDFTRPTFRRGGSKSSTAALASYIRRVMVLFAFLVSTGAGPPSTFRTLVETWSCRLLIGHRGATMKTTVRGSVLLVCTIPEGGCRAVWNTVSGLMHPGA